MEEQIAVLHRATDRYCDYNENDDILMASKDIGKLEEVRKDMIEDLMNQAITRGDHKSSIASGDHEKGKFMNLDEWKDYYRKTDHGFIITLVYLV